MKSTVCLSIGEYHASKEPAVVYTTLGSCVAACLFDPVTRIGGMNHILMPGKAHLDKCDAASRFGVNAMELLINALMKSGADRRRIVAKVFGGANVIPGISRKYAVGHKIAAFIVEFMATEKIRILSRDLGGIYTRKLFFHTDTGDVFMQRIHSTIALNLAVEEQKKLTQVKKRVKDPMDYTLF
jgi:chemotaxis protein CheD